MGVKGFSKVFDAKIIKMKDLSGQTAAIDASVMLYKAALGAARLNTLTDSTGAPTLHLNVIMAKILNAKKDNIHQIWVFDYHEDGYSPPDKALELEKRKKKRLAAEKKLANLQEKQKTREEELFSSDDEDDAAPVAIAPKSHEEKVAQAEKECFRMNSTMVNDCKYILECFDIAWITAPKGFEAEHLCAALTQSGQADFVLSTDIDAIMYNCKRLVRDVKLKKKKVLQSYVVADILEKYDLTMNNMRKIAAILGTDKAAKTPRIGPGTVLKKYKTTQMTDEQNEAIAIFQRDIVIPNFKEIPIAKAVSNKQKINNLLDWLVSKKFNRARVQKQIDKAMKPKKVAKKAA